SWMGTFPSNIRWGGSSETIYFDYNLKNDPSDSLYKIDIRNRKNIVKVSLKEQKEMIPSYGEFNNAKTKKLVIDNGKLVLFDLKKEDEEELLEMGGRISEASFLSDENLVSFNYEDNIYLYDLKNGSLKKLTNIHSGEKKDRKGSGSGSEKAKWLEKENLDLLQVVRERKENAEASKRYREMTQDPEEFAFYAGKKQISGLNLSPDARFATFSL